jgi:hypothetical protein
VRPARTVVFDNEAVQALVDVAHPKHRRVLAVIEAVASRNLRRAGTTRLVVPTTVRAESGWDRRRPRAAAVNRLRIDDADLDGAAADGAATVRRTLGVSVTDAHVAVTIAGSDGPHAVLTSDVDDIERIARHVGAELRILAV